MRFTMTVPAGVTVTAPQVLVQLSGGRGGNTWHEDDDIWNLTRTDGNAGSLSVWWNTFLFTRPDIVGPQTVSLWFNLTTMTQGGTASRGTITISSADAATGPTATFGLLRQNAGASPGFITTPPA